MKHSKEMSNAQFMKLMRERRLGHVNPAEQMAQQLQDCLQLTLWHFLTCVHRVMDGYSSTGPVIQALHADSKMREYEYTTRGQTVLVRYAAGDSCISFLRNAGMLRPRPPGELFHVMKMPRGASRLRGSEGADQELWIGQSGTLATSKLVIQARRPGSEWKTLASFRPHRYDSLMQGSMVFQEEPTDTIAHRVAAACFVSNRMFAPAWRPGVVQAERPETRRELSAHISAMRPKSGPPASWGIEVEERGDGDDDRVSILYSRAGASFWNGMGFLFRPPRVTTALEII